MAAHYGCVGVRAMLGEVPAATAAFRGWRAMATRKEDDDAHADPTESLGLIADTTAGPGSRDLEKSIGAEIRRHRHRADITLMALARQAGVSQGMMSKIENGQTSPSLSTLAALADALSIPLSALFTPLEHSRDASFVPAGKGLQIDRRGTKAGHVYRLLGHGVRGPVGVEPYLITLHEDSEPFGDFLHEGVEFIHMLEGELVYRHGERRFRMGPGDSLFFDAIAPHGPIELTRLPCRYLTVISYPRSDGGGIQ